MKSKKADKALKRRAKKKTRAARVRDRKTTRLPPKTALLSAASSSSATVSSQVSAAPGSAATTGSSVELPIRKKFRANPADGIWAIKDPPNSATFYMVCTHRDESGGGGALLFHSPVTGRHPNDLALRKEVDRQFSDCIRWLRVSAKAGLPIEQWPDPPHSFSMAMSSVPGRCSVYGPKAPPGVVTHWLRMLANVWETWVIWSKTQELPSYKPKTVAFDDPGWNEQEGK